jgi:hypothetical protein
MFQTIHEKISVAGVYQNSRFIPKKFSWRERVYLVDTITLVSDIRDGAVKKRMYSIMCKRNLYRLVFNRETEIWMLEATWCE